MGLLDFRYGFQTMETAASARLNNKISRAAVGLLHEASVALQGLPSSSLPITSEPGDRDSLVLQHKVPRSALGQATQWHPALPKLTCGRPTPHPFDSLGRRASSGGERQPSDVSHTTSPYVFFIRFHAVHVLHVL